MEQRGIEREPGGRRVPAPNGVKGDFDAVIKWLRSARAHRDEIIARFRPSLASLPCSFCGTGISECASSMGGAKAVICDRCAVDSFDMLMRSGWQPSGRRLSPGR
jgi:hypothetical protein